MGGGRPGAGHGLGGWGCTVMYVPAAAWPGLGGWAWAAGRPASSECVCGYACVEERVCEACDLSPTEMSCHGPRFNKIVLTTRS